MDHLNFFNPFSHKEVGQEDPLTRAFLVLLRYEPQAQAIVLDLIREELTEYTSIPTLTQMSRTADIMTQAVSLPQNIQRLVSVLITDEKIENLPCIEPIERGARYDGVLDYGDWTFIIENKPSAGDVWQDQLKPAKSSLKGSTDVQVISRCVCLVWREIILRLGQLEQNQLLSHQGEIMLGDFLAMIDDEYSFLAPFKSFSLCKNDPDRLVKRCRLIVANIAKMVNLEVGNRRSRFPYIYYPEGIVEEIDLESRSIRDVSKSWELCINLWPADTVTQAKAFYAVVNRGMLLKLLDKGWDIRPNLHFSYMSTHLVWSFFETPIEDYLDIWMEKKHPYGQWTLEGHNLDKLEKDFTRMGLIGAEVNEELESKFAQTARNHINVIPGLHMTYKIDQEKAIEWERANSLESNLITIMNGGLSPWGQKLII